MNRIPQGRPTGPQEVQIPAIQVPITGLKAEFHLTRHKIKQSRHPLDAGMDLYPSEIKSVTPRGEIADIMVHTMLECHIAPGFKGIIHSRSSSIDRLCGGIVISGIIDAGYQGELLIRVVVINKPHAIESVLGAVRECQRGTIAIAQLLIEQCLVLCPVIPNLPPPSIGGRGTNGFGSTDKLIGH